MHPVISSRWARLEERRKALVEKVKALPPERQSRKPSSDEFSPVQVVMHMALAEGYDLEQIKKKPPSALKGKKTGSTFIYRTGVRKMLAGKQMPTFAAMVPSEKVSLEQAEQAWEKTRRELAVYLEQAEDANAPMMRMLLLGTLDAGAFLTLLEAHTSYHELRFPRV